MHANLSPQLSVDLQTQQFCSTNWDCAPSATGTSRVLRSPFVNNSFHEQGMGSTLLRDKRATTALADVCALKYIDNVARVIKNGSGNQQRKPGRKTACTALQNIQRSRAKRKTTPLRRPSTDRRTCSVSAQNMHLKTGARKHKELRRSVSSCVLTLCGRSTETFPHCWISCLHDNVF